jgi:glycosyltransferase involved in cell wall biosynthesis
LRLLQKMSITDTGSNPFKEFWAIYQFYHILKRRKVDLLLTYTIKANLYGTVAAKWKGIPVICNISGLGTAFLADKFSSRVARLLSSRILVKADHLFFQNRNDQVDFCEVTGADLSKSSLLPGSGIDLQTFKYTPSSIPSTYQFLVLARVIIEKGIREFAEAARLVKTEFPEAKFLVVGNLDETHSRSISQREVNDWEKKGLIDYFSHRDDIANLITEAEVLVLPSYREGTPRSLLEGAAMGRPLITTDVPGCREVVEHEVNGYLCEVKSASSLAEMCIKYLCLSQKEKWQMGKKSRELAEMKFDEKYVISAYLDKIKDLT